MPTPTVTQDLHFNFQRTSDFQIYRQALVKEQSLYLKCVRFDTAPGSRIKPGPSSREASALTIVIYCKSGYLRAKEICTKYAVTL